MHTTSLVLQAFENLQEWVQTWQHPTNASIPLFYTLSWDWRRDLWEQSAHVLSQAEYVYNQTQCRPILVGHSYGGRLIYVGMGRYRERLARYVAAVLYAVAPLQTDAGIAPGAHLALALSCI